MNRNYFDKRGNYVNIENLTLYEIYKRGYEDGLTSLAKAINNIPCESSKQETRVPGMREKHS